MPEAVSDKGDGPITPAGRAALVGGVTQWRPSQGSSFFKYGFVAVLSCAFLVRAAAVWYVPDLVPEPSYQAPAQEVASGIGLGRVLVLTFSRGESHRTPSYPLFLALLVKLFGAHGPLVAMGHHMTGLATAACLMLLGRELAGDLGGLAAGALYLADLNPPLFECAGFSESLMAPLIVAAVLACVRVARGARTSAGAGAAAGALGAAAALCRPEFSLFGALPLAFALAPGRSFFRLRRCGLAVSAAFFALMAAWLARNRVVEGSFTLSTNGPVTLLQRSYTLVDYASPVEPLAKQALREAQDPAYASEGDVPHVAERLLKERYGMDETSASRALGRVWREAVLHHPGPWLLQAARNIELLLFPPSDFPAPQLFDMLLVRWPPALQARWRRLDFFSLARRTSHWSLALERAMAWGCLAGMLLAVFEPAGLFVVLAYLLLLASVALSATSYQYYFEFQPFHVLFSAVLAAEILGSSRRLLRP